jgi:hypothetical protein
LFDKFTPDSFQPRLLNTATLIEELSTVLARAKSQTLWHKHAEIIKQELRQVVPFEQDLLARCPRYQWLVQRLIESENLQDSLLLCRLLEQQRPVYEEGVFVGLRESVRGLPKDKEKTLRGIRRLATLAVHSGKDDDDVLAVVCDDNLKKDPTELVELLIEVTTRRERAFECVLTIAGQQRDVQRISRKVGFELIRESHLPAHIVAELKSKREGVYFVIARTNARSAREAARTCAGQLRPAIDLLNLYSNQAVLELLDIVFLRANLNEDFREFTLGEPALRRLHARKHAIDLTHNTLNRHAAEKFEPRVTNALELHSLAHGSTAPRVQLVNLWSAVECLAAVDQSDSIIGRVSRVFAPIVVWRRVEKIVRYLAINLHGLIRDGHKEWLGPGFPNSKAHFVDAWEAMLTLCKPDNHPDILQLLKFSAGHPLLCYHIYSQWKDLHDPARIYRARNLIVHDGIETPMLGALLDNLQFYFSVTLSRILHGMTMCPNWGVAESIIFWKERYRYVTEMLVKSPNVLTLADFFPGDERNISPKIWTT